MNRWSDAKLERELLSADGEQRAAIAAEMARRNAIDDGEIEGEYGP